MLHNLTNQRVGNTWACTLHVMLAVLLCENDLSSTEHRRARGDFSVREEHYVGCLDQFRLRQ